MKALSNVVLVATWTKFTLSHSNSDVVFSCADKLESLSPQILLEGKKKKKSCYLASCIKT